MKKFVFYTLLLCLLFMLTACGEAIPPSDDVQTNHGNAFTNPIMKNDSGYFYNNPQLSTMSLRYYDATSGSTIYLCNKPECSHDGNKFCVATNDDYIPLFTCFYDNYIYVAAFYNIENEYSYKLLRIKPDGTELTEIATYKELSGLSTYNAYNRYMIIHRGKAFIPYQIIDTVITKNPVNMNPMTGVTGTAIVDLSSGKVEYLDEYSLTDTNGQSNFKACEDYFYYTTNLNHKTTLYRYHLTTKETQSLPTKINFGGVYSVADNNNIYYLRTQLYLYHPDTDETINLINTWPSTYTITLDDGTVTTTNMDFQASGLQCDGTYLYVGDNCSSITGTSNYFSSLGSYIHMYTLDGTEVAKVPCNYRDYISVNILDGMLYLQSEEKMISCTIESMLTETPDFKEILTFKTN